MRELLLTVFILIPVLGWSYGFQFGLDSVVYPSEGVEGTEIQAWLGYDYSWPVLRGGSSLTRNNNLEAAGIFSLSPVSTTGELVFTLTPAAFFELEQGTHLGTGWSLSDDLAGLGLNRDGMADRSADSLNGYVFKTWLGASLQFDLAELLADKNEYAHVILKTTFRYQYQYYSGAGRDEAWRYQADDGRNFNGVVEKTKTVLGYLIPHSALDFAGLIMETENYLGHVRSLSSMDDGGWGSDFMEIHIGPLVNWQIAEHHALTLLVQWGNGLDYTDDTEDEDFFMNRSCTGDTSFSFERVALSYKYTW